jgi:glutaminyl-tRNA synthetase
VLSNITIGTTPHQYEFSRLNLEYTVLSKRKLIQLVEEKQVNGWDDPRMPTVAGLRRRGYTSASVREFCKRIGVTKMDNMVEMSMLEACLREELNADAPRAMAVLEPLKLVIENYEGDDVENLIAPKHPSNESMGHRSVPFGKEIFIEAEDFKEEANKKFKRLVLGKEVRLRNAYVIKAERVEKDEQGNITTVYCSYDKDTLGTDPADGRKVKGVIHWVSAANGIPAEIRLYDRLFKVPNPAAEEDLLACINEQSLVVKQGIVEPSLVNAQLSAPVQFERTGYFCKDKDSQFDKLVFNRAVGLRDTWAKMDQG